MSKCHIVGNLMHWLIYAFFTTLQLRTELVCDIGFCRNDPETLISIGKEHIRWWKIYPDSHTIQSSAKPEYEVGYAKYTWASYDNYFIRVNLLASRDSDLALQVFVYNLC